MHIEPSSDDPAPTTARSTDRSAAQEEARERALARVCQGFRTTVSPRSAARLADLMTPETTYELAA